MTALLSGCLGCPAVLLREVEEKRRTIRYHLCADDGLGEGRVKKIQANTLRSGMVPFWCPRRRDNRRKAREKR
jgi:hypothetical protein